jgi:hypothetical protein
MEDFWGTVDIWSFLEVGIGGRWRVVGIIFDYWKFIEFSCKEL